VTLKDIQDYLNAVVVADAQPFAKLFFNTAGPLAFVATTLAVEGFAKRFLNVASVQRPAKI
jgi:hypothetical protein